MTPTITITNQRCPRVQDHLRIEGINNLHPKRITVPQGYFELVQALEKSQAIFSFRGLKVVQPRPEAEARHSDQEMEEPEIFSRPGQAQNSPTDTFFLWMGLRPTINPTTQIIYAQTLIKHKYVQHFYPSFNSYIGRASDSILALQNVRGFESHSHHEILSKISTILFISIGTQLLVNASNFVYLCYDKLSILELVLAFSRPGRNKATTRLRKS